MNLIPKMSEFCFICKRLSIKSETITVDYGIKKLINASTLEYLKNQKSVTIYVHCHENYNRKPYIAAASKR